MAVHTFTKPYVVSARGAKQLEDVLKSPSPRRVFANKARVTTIKDMAEKYGKKQ